MQGNFYRKIGIVGVKGGDVLRGIDGIDPGFLRDRFAEHWRVVAAVQRAEAGARAAKTLLRIGVDAQESHDESVAGLRALHVKRAGEGIWAGGCEARRFEGVDGGIGGSGVDDISLVNAHDWRDWAEDIL